MSQPHRSIVFLQEMGVGPQWLLRDRVAAPPEYAEEEAIDAAPEPVMEAAPAPEPALAPAPAPAPIAPPAQPVAQSDDDMSWFDEAPAPPPKAPVLKQSAPPRPKASEPETAEDTSWFDAVPAAPVQRAPARTAATDEEIAAMDWPTLQAAVRRCTRCDLCATRRAAVPGQGDEQARWLVLGTAPTAEDEEVEQPLSGQPGQLLANMLNAVGLSTERGAYVTTLVKCRAVAEDGTDRLPSADELAACRPYLDRELALTGAGLALTVGGVTAKGLLGMAARGKVLRYGELPVVATFHPADLLKKPEDKARAWADLCLARSAHAGRR
ncbi:DNA polymerase [Pseudoduganella flava]|uniref:DNA polymerase n=1 Tax=Pseudoduganella flava TaxID=871742 RepID=A0A562PJZ3_9BURK|nr:uracil-DNA glycosylase [Pseudoduganella flava]QGZ42245.1 uracil-DNA glycosylase [Pseudoduganella flava]TWI44782.1 DNA polymerase [Pseudoduganella flava]